MPLCQHCSEVRKSPTEVQVRARSASEVRACPLTPDLLPWSPSRQVFPAARFADLKAASDAMRAIADGWGDFFPEVSPAFRGLGLQPCSFLALPPIT